MKIIKTYDDKLTFNEKISTSNYLKKINNYKGRRSFDSINYP